MMDTRRLLSWYERHKRELPWRTTRDPYAVWVSEIMLQQTQVSTVLPYYQRWMQRFPTLVSLSEADDQVAFANWQGLGYYRRCENLLRGVRHVVREGYPGSAEQWREIPGVGAYTAAALASITLNEPTAVVDGNVMRVFARQTASQSSGGQLMREATKWANEHIPSDRPGDFNQALMELGATVCRPAKPECEMCPIAQSCEALSRGLTSSLPRRKPRANTIELAVTTWVPRYRTLFGVQQITSGKWWRGLWEFPTASDVLNLSQICEPSKLTFRARFRHTVTKHRITFNVWNADLDDPVQALTWLKGDELERLPMSAPMRKAMTLVSSD